MHEPSPGRIHDLERSVQRWRLTSLALLLALLSFMAISGTLGVILILVGDNRREIEMMRMDAEMAAREQAELAHQQAEVARQEAERALQEQRNLREQLEKQKQELEAK
jgi:hypothetical protein